MIVNKSINENAADDWIKLVKKHRKNQKGLPALSNLKTNAGIVELNNAIFNASANPEGLIVDASSGNVTAPDCGGMGEDLKEKSYDDLDDEFDMSTRTLL